ncbi:hypothetical protein D9619_012643 [Psilocybe cf. subviscida]|uniref:Uncharacterized protein n=1 Tax=Psilocybe cf. subviscida TaxID=2480587 RepID=A0A8H5EZ49_9AGAR|nr:hypothetical protein D9619_012643 [Psilocybe cf. subviscida]
MADDIPVAPAPWILKGTSWTFILSGLSTTTSFPAGFSAEFQTEALVEGGQFAGGFGGILLVSYSESPVGPYDELIYLPGKWKYAGKGEAFRITRIYVSSKASTMNGRRNWNIPKQVANFQWSESSSGKTVSVFHPGETTPFFKATIQSIPLVSAISCPTSTGILGKWCTVFQPPIPASSAPEEVGTDKWAALLPVLKGNARIVKVVGALEGGKFGDGKGFPDVMPWSTGMCLENATIDFGNPTIYDSV